MVKAIATLEPLNLFEMDPSKLEEAFHTVKKESRLRDIGIVARKVSETDNLKWSEGRCEFEVGE